MIKARNQRGPAIPLRQLKEQLELEELSRNWNRKEGCLGRPPVSSTDRREWGGELAPVWTGHLA